MTATEERTSRRTERGVEGNARLTSSVGLVLLVMLAVEGATVLNVRGLLSLHVFLGIMLVPPAAVKTATTVYRFARYYRGAAPYVRKGPPHVILRVLGPLVVLSTVGLLGTGLALVLPVPGGGQTWLTLHQGSFIAWFAVMTVHVLGHLVEAGRATRDDVRDREDRRGRAVRLAVLTVTLVAAVGLATALWPAAGHSQWSRGPDGPGPVAGR